MTIRTRGAGANGALISASNSCMKSARSSGYGMPLAVVRPSRASAIAASNSSSIRRQGRASNPVQWSHAPTRRELDSLRGPAQALFELGKEAQVMACLESERQAIPIPRDKASVPGVSVKPHAPEIWPLT
jgi:hypothetical protein